MKFEVNTIYLTKTVEDATELLKLAHDAGYKWCNDESFLKEVNWQRYRENTCYYIVRGTFGLRDSYSSSVKRVQFSITCSLNNLII